MRNRAFIPTYVVSLADSEARRRSMTSQLGAAGVPFQFFDCVDGRTQRVPDCIDGARVVRERFKTEGALACTATHRLLHRMIAQGEAEAVVILEDDAIIPPDFADIVEAALAFEFDAFKLEGVNASKRRITVGHLARYDVVITSRPAVGSAGYILRRDAARRICTLPVLDWTCDYIFQDTRLRLRVLEMNPFCVRQDEAIGSQMPQSLSNPGYVPPRKWSIARLIESVKRKAAIASIHGPAALARLESQRIGRWLNR
ncbi:MAG TPA: glycosyltransferase family 25 protein [Xanthobacteraceae bacterium]